MEHQLFLSILAVLNTLDQRSSPFWEFSDHDIVTVFYWAVLHDRPVSWAVQARNWPLHRRSRPLPSNTTMSRRLRTRSVQALLSALERRVAAPPSPGFYWIIDGKPLPIGGASHDPHAGYGRAVGGKAWGYKIHAILDFQGKIAAWRLTPMNTDERTMAARMLRTADIHGYIVGDRNYDSNPLHAICGARGDLQLVTRRRNAGTKGLGNHKQEPGRLRSVALTEDPFPEFAESLLHDRGAIERAFGNWTSAGGGLGPLPAWVRSYPRVHRWVQAKLTIHHLRKEPKT
jgi:hypothetical protein